LRNFFFQSHSVEKVRRALLDRELRIPARRGLRLSQRQQATAQDDFRHLVHSQSPACRFF
jgi:hypothetical protein